MRPPALCVQDELTRENASSFRDGTVPTTSSRLSSVYRAVEEAAAARTAMLQAEAEAQRASARLADTRVECNEQNKVITAELEAMQDSGEVKPKSCYPTHHCASCESGCHGISPGGNVRPIPPTRITHGNTDG